MARSGPVALVGAGEFLPAMADFDVGLLSATGRPRPRVVVLPTASYPDGETVFRRWAAMGVDHFSALGAEVEPVLIRDRAGADDDAHAQAIGEADLVYLSDGRARHLLDTLEGSRAGRAIWDASRRGAIIAGCSAGAMALGDRHWSFRRRLVPTPVRWRRGLGLVSNLSVIPRYDARPEALCALLAMRAPRGSVVVGIDTDTAVVGRDGSWQVHGRSRVTVWRGRHRERFRSGDAFRL